MVSKPKWWPKKKEGSKVTDRCHQDKDTGAVVCTRKRVNQDGTEVDIAGFTMSVDARCRLVPDETYEHEEGQLDELERKFLPKIAAKCRSAPQEY